MAFKLQVEERSENPLEWEFIDPTTPGKPLFTVTHPNVDGHHGGDHSYSFKDFRDDKEGYKFATIGPRIKPYKVEIIPCLEATYVDTWLQLYDDGIGVRFHFNHTDYFWEQVDGNTKFELTVNCETENPFATLTSKDRGFDLEITKYDLGTEIEYFCIVCAFILHKGFHSHMKLGDGHAVTESDTGHSGP